MQTNRWSIFLQKLHRICFSCFRIHREDDNVTELEQLTNKTEHLLLQVKMQVDLTYLDFEQLKTNVILRPRPILEGNCGIDQDEEVLNGHDDRVLTKSNTRFDQSECDFENCENWPPFVYVCKNVISDWIIFIWGIEYYFNFNFYYLSEKMLFQIQILLFEEKEYYFRFNFL